MTAATRRRFKAEHSYPMDVGRRVRARRLELGLTLRAVAARSDISDSTVSSIEKGTFGLGIPVLLVLCRALECSPNHLLGWEETP